MNAINDFPIKTEDMNIAEKILFRPDVNILKGKRKRYESKTVCRDYNEIPK